MSNYVFYTLGVLSYFPGERAIGARSHIEQREMGVGAGDVTTTKESKYQEIPVGILKWTKFPVYPLSGFWSLCHRSSAIFRLKTGFASTDFNLAIHNCLSYWN